MGFGNRRTFLKILLAGIASFFILIWNKLTLSHLEILNKKESFLPLNKNKQVTFYKNYIVINLNETTTVFSAHCTHLGCRINNMENGKIVCPCHGSEYDLEGKVIKGPAYKNLEIIPLHITPDGKNIEITG